MNNEIAGFIGLLFISLSIIWIIKSLQTMIKETK